METNEKIVVKDVYKIFGPHPERALENLKAGATKTEIFEQTGMTVGVDNAAFSVYAGEIFVIMGLSGSGKSTLVRLLNRLIEPTAGRIVVNGQSVMEMKPDELMRFRRNTMSMVFQSFALMPHLSVLENAALGLKLAKVDKRKRGERAAQALEQVGLSGWENSYPDQLSGGMQQRVGLARCLAVDPDILLMDEAFSALDPLIRAEMQDELLELQAKDQRTIVFISHDLDEALKIGSRIAIMEGGRIIQIGTPEEILQNPANEYVSAFFRGVDPTNVISAGDIVRDSHPTIIKNKTTGLRSALERLTRSDRKHGYVLDTGHHFLGVVSSDSLRSTIEKVAIDSAKGTSIEQAFLAEARPVLETDSMQAILSEVASKEWPIPVVDDTHKFKGVVSKNRFLKTLHRSQEEDHV